jgi:hypothetical protein
MLRHELDLGLLQGSRDYDYCCGGGRRFGHGFLDQKVERSEGILCRRLVGQGRTREDRRGVRALFVPMHPRWHPELP